MVIRRWYLTAAVAMLTLLAGGCASGGRTGSGTERNVITMAELEEFRQASAYEVIQRLRPHFLQQRGSITYARTDNYPAVYVDNVRCGGLNELRQIPAGSLQRIEYISPADATTRWGTGHVSGVIAVHTRR